MSELEIFTATCSLCPWTVGAATHHEGGCLASWHLYEEHPGVWRGFHGDRAPRDPDPRTPEGKQRALAEMS